MSKVWKVVGIICVVLLVLSAALIGVSYATGGSISRLMQTTDIFDMTKFATRDQLEQIVSSIPFITK